MLREARLDLVGHRQGPLRGVAGRIVEAREDRSDVLWTEPRQTSKRRLTVVDRRIRCATEPTRTALRGPHGEIRLSLGAVLGRPRVTLTGVTLSQAQLFALMPEE